MNELLQTISYKELMEWRELEVFDPWGEERADLRNAMMIAYHANLNRDKKKRSTPFKHTEFMPYLKAREEVIRIFHESQSPPKRHGAHITPGALTMLFLKAGAKPPADEEGER